MYYANIPFTNADDVLFVTYPGSGTTWLANIMSELRLPYIDGYTEKLVGKYELNTEILESKDRKRTPGLEKSFNNRPNLTPPRIIKTHLWPNYFEDFKVKNVILLVRDGRDSVLSYYKWRLSFSEEGETGTFSEFLRRPGFNGVLPLEDWALTINNWKNSIFVENILLLQFEESKAWPKIAIGKLLNFLKTTRSDNDINEAIRVSSYENMRKVEEEVLKNNPDLAKGMIMRNGSHGQWKEAFSTEDLKLLEGMPLSVLKELGYL